MFIYLSILSIYLSSRSLLFLFFFFSLSPPSSVSSSLPHLNISDDKDNEFLQKIHHDVNLRSFTCWQEHPILVLNKFTVELTPSNWYFIEYRRKGHYCTIKKQQPKQHSQNKLLGIKHQETDWETMYSKGIVVVYACNYSTHEAEVGGLESSLRFVWTT